MIKPKILVTTAAGKTGSATAVQLLEQDYPVRAIVRAHEHRSETLRRLGPKSSLATWTTWSMVAQPSLACSAPISTRRLRRGRLPPA